MGDPELMKWFASLGVGGVIAGFMFLFYRRDSLQWIKVWQEQAQRFEAQTNVLIDVVKENAATIAANTKTGEAIQLQLTQLTHLLTQRKDRE